MRTFRQHILKNLTEAVSIEQDRLTHLTHGKDVGHESPKHAQYSIDLLRELHKLRQGKPSTVQATLKHDGGASVHIIHDKNGRIGISDKHRLERKEPVIAYSEQDIDEHFGQHPDYAKALKHLLRHGKEIVSRGHHVQGDILFTPDDSTHQRNGENISYAPNRIAYQGRTSAPLGIAIHTELTNGIAHSVTPNAVRSSRNIFIPRLDFRPEEHPYSKESRAAVEHHLTEAQKLLNQHTTDHLTPDHIEHFTIYNNRVARGSRNPSVAGYIKFLKERGEEETAKRKSEAGQQKVKAKYEGMIKSALENEEHFNRSLQIRHHLEQATDHITDGIKHPDLRTSVDGQPSKGEGLVLQTEDENGKWRHAVKTVDSGIQYEIGNNPRFGPAGKSRIDDVPEEESHVHAFYGNLKYAHAGHTIPVNQAIRAAEKDRKKGRKVTTVVGLSNSPGPLGLEGKKEHAASILNHPVETGEDHTRDFLTFAREMHRRGHTHLTVHAGSDRVEEYQKLLDRYNGKPTKSGEVLFNFKQAKVAKAGKERQEGELKKDPSKMSDAELLASSKASRLEKYAREGTRQAKRSFFAYHRPLNLSRETIEGHWNNLRNAVAAAPASASAAKKPRKSARTLKEEHRPFLLKSFKQFKEEVVHAPPPTPPALVRHATSGEMGRIQANPVAQLKTDPIGDLIKKSAQPTVKPSVPAAQAKTDPIGDLIKKTQKPTAKPAAPAAKPAAAKPPAAEEPSKTDPIKNMIRWTKPEKEPKTIADLQKRDELEHFYKTTFALEGPSGKVTTDTGGTTRYGIAGKYYPHLDIPKVTPELARDIYKKDYWDKLDPLDHLEPKARAVVRDAAVNQGVGYANQLAKRHNGNVDAMIEDRRARYIETARQKPLTHAKYLRGWFNRLDKLKNIHLKELD